MGSLPRLPPPCGPSSRHLFPRDKIVTFTVPGPVAELDPANAYRRRAAQAIREHFLAGLAPDVVHVSSMVEGFVDNCVTSVGVHDSSFSTAVTFYDAIPLLSPEKHLCVPGIKDYYLRKMQWFKRSDILLAISESSRREAIEALHIPEDRVVNISTGIEEQFRIIEIRPDDRLALLRKCGVTRPFIMYSGAIDIRKNLEGLIAALALLPARARDAYQLLIVGKNDDAARKRLQDLARKNGLRDDTVLFSGYVSNDDLVALYNLCSLFVLPSFHEGFGLPVLEAMACGAPAIASNVTSLPEVVGWNDAMFDPHQPAEIAARVDQALTDKGFRQKLRDHGLRQAKQFTWERTAKTAWGALEESKLRKQRGNDYAPSTVAGRAKSKMAYFSPLPPERSGISDYSAELLPELARYYEIEVVVQQDAVTDNWVNANFPVRSVSWFERHASEYERIVYQMGNSPFHVYMFDVLRRYPGVLVLHDLYQSAVLNWMAISSGSPGQFSRAVFDSHGYLGLLQESEFGREWAVRNLPCSLLLIQAAAGVIVHSEFARKLADQCYGAGTASAWKVVPQLRSQPPGNREVSRAHLGISTEDYLVCSFGFLAHTKLDDRLLSGWINSRLANDERCHLVFVGENEGAEYGRQLLTRIAERGAAARVRITGHVPPQAYRDYLSAADCAVQLRTDSRGETSRALLDCLSCGLPTIINSHGSLAEVPDTVASKLPDAFTDAQLAEALDHMYLDTGYRQKLAGTARDFVRLQHHPAHIAEAYRDAIESFAISHPLAIEQRLLNDLASMTAAAAPSHGDYVATARAIAMNRRGGTRQLMLDVSATAKNDLKTGIERVARNLSRELIKNPGTWQVEPIRFAEGRRLYARQFGLRLVNAQTELEESAVAFRAGDVYLALDWCPETVVGDRRFFDDLRALDIPIYFLIHDVLPLLRPEKFPDWAVADFRRWFGGLCEVSDGLICVSRSGADELLAYLDREPPNRMRPLKIAYSYSGADSQDLLPRDTISNNGIPPEAGAMLNAMKSRPSLLMVGTLEPRKGHLLALDAFDMLWAEGVEANLVILGHEGWHAEPLVNRLNSHAQSGRKLFWLNAADDDVLLRAYGAASGLLAASEAEGFGLPLIEAARHGLPILARDIPVFREVAGDNAYYFQGDSAKSLKEAVRSWLELRVQGKAPPLSN